MEQTRGVIPHSDGKRFGIQLSYIGNRIDADATPHDADAFPPRFTFIVSAPNIWKYLDEKSVKKFGTRNTLLWGRRESAIIAHDITSDALARKTVQSHNDKKTKFSS